MMMMMIANMHTRNNRLVMQHHFNYCHWRIHRGAGGGGGDYGAAEYLERVFLNTIHTTIVTACTVVQAVV